MDATQPSPAEVTALADELDLFGAIPALTERVVPAQVLAPQMIEEIRHPETGEMLRPAAVNLGIGVGAISRTPDGRPAMFIERLIVDDIEPEFAVQVGEAMAELGRQAIASRTEQPVRPGGIEIIGSMDVADKVAQAAGSVNQALRR